jgi:hypothetical protein
VKIASLVTLALAALVVIVGFFPCLGWVNWIGAPFCLLPTIAGIVARRSSVGWCSAWSGPPAA